MDKKELCRLVDARAYIDGIMEEVEENSPAWKVLVDAWCVLDQAIKENESQRGAIL